MKPKKPHPAKRTVIYTDGGCIQNPGPGGYGIVMLYNGQRQEFSGGYRKTTNNRMELMACIVALKAFEQNGPCTLYSDSKYVVNGITKRWATGWRARGWKKSDGNIAENIDLWAELLELCENRRVEFKWVKGHAGIPENERCDQLAQQAIARKNLKIDTVYERGDTQVARKNIG
jgi:ribonuclease HI